MQNGNTHHHSQQQQPQASSTSFKQQDFTQYPKNVGILALEVYFPVQYVEQTKLEKFDQVSSGKYTIGLGQQRMSFCLDNEDINSICLTALNNLFDNYEIDPRDIGRLDVGTETLIDKSKSIKTTLMKLFEDSGNFDVEGVDNVNACFGGTAALFNAVNWIESSYWDGRYACVVMGDIAVYAKGNARPTGGAGAVAVLVGPNAPLVFERGLRSTYIAHAYDFYKPVMDSEYPIVDGQLSVVCYLNALDKCYNQYKKKYLTLTSNHLLNDINNNNSDEDTDDSEQFSLHMASAFLFHSPYCKLVQKSFARLLWNDFLESKNTDKKNKNDLAKNGLNESSSLDRFMELSRDETFTNKDLERELVRLSEPLFKKKTCPSLLLAKEIGNMYTPSLYGCLASHLLSKSCQELKNSRLCLFSYGSGLAASMFSLFVSENVAHHFTLDKIHSNLSKQKRTLTEHRVEIEPELYDNYLKQREVSHKKAPRQSSLCPSSLFPGTWFFKSIDEKYRRVYERSAVTNERFDSEKVGHYLSKELGDKL